MAKEKLDRSTAAKQLKGGTEKAAKKRKSSERGETKFEKKAKKVKVMQPGTSKLKNMKGMSMPFSSDNAPGAKKRKLPGKKIDASQKQKKPKLEEMTKKERKKQRRMMKSNFEDIAAMKRIWEDIRRRNITKEKRTELIQKLFNVCKGKICQYVFAHDTARVIQCLLKFSNSEQRMAVFEEVKDHLVAMCKSKYAKFLVVRFLRYGTKEQTAIVMKSFHGSVRKLVKHTEAAEVVESAYNDYANAHQRAAIIEEFYGPGFALFKSPEIRTLEQIMKANPEKKETILNYMKEALGHMSEKSVLRHSIVHRVFMEYFMYASQKQKAEMIENLREHLPEMLHTRDGSRVAMMCVWHGTAKDRKVIIKSLKSYVSKICQEEHGHLVLLALFDVVDDTKIVQKIIIHEMMGSLQTLAVDKYGMKVLLYLLAPRDPLHFHPDIVKILKQGDDNPNSKKDVEMRRHELLQAASKPVLKCVIDNTVALATNSSTLLLILTVLKHSTENPTEAFKALSAVAGEPFCAGDSENFHLIEHPAGHITLKKLIQNDKNRIEAGETVLFSKVLIDTVPSGSLRSWASCNRGCFTLVTLLELEQPDVAAHVKKELEGIRKSLEHSSFKGGQILWDKLK